MELLRTIANEYNRCHSACLEKVQFRLEV